MRKKIIKKDESIKIICSWSDWAKMLTCNPPKKDILSVIIGIDSKLRISGAVVYPIIHFPENIIMIVRAQEFKICNIAGNKRMIIRRTIDALYKFLKENY